MAETQDGCVVDCGAKQERGWAALRPAADGSTRVRPNSPAFFTVWFHAATDLEAAKRNDEARRILDRLIESNPPLNVKNLLIAARMKIARNWDEFLADALRRPMGESGGDEFGDDAVLYQTR